MKFFVLTHRYQGDGASEMLLSAAAHWTHTLGWHADAVTTPHMTAAALQAVVASGMCPVARAPLEAGYDFALINCLQNIKFVDLLYPHLPVVLWAHEAETVLHSNVPPVQWKQWLAKLSLLIFQTDWQYQLFNQYLSADLQIAIIPNGIPFVPIPISRPAEMHDPVRIVTVGKLSPMKGQSDLIAAVTDLAIRHRLHCTLIGDTEHLHMLGDSAQAMLKQAFGLFTLPGYLPRAEALKKTAGADLFCFPSLSESFGLAPLEAAALGVPVVLADLAPYRLIGWVSGENCLMYPPGNRAMLATCLETLMVDASLRERLSNNGKALAGRYAMEPCLLRLSRRLSEFVADADLHRV